MTNPNVFIVGCPRSGTTLFRHMVDAHPQLAVTPEAHWIPLWFEERRGLTADGYVTPELISIMLADRKFALFQIGREDLLSLAQSNAPLAYASFVARIHDYYGKIRGKLRVGNKTPDSARRMGTLHSLWPETPFVHLIRDGRDVALSLCKWSRVHDKKPGTFPTWKEEPVATAALWWELNVRCGRQGGQQLGPRLYREMRYEHLIAEPAEQCAALCAFLGLPYSEAMLHYAEQHRGTTPPPPDWQPIRKGLRDWRSQMPREDVEVFEATVGDLLDELGYERAVATPPAGARKRAARVRAALADALQGLSRPRAPLKSMPAVPAAADIVEGRRSSRPPSSEIERS